MKRGDGKFGAPDEKYMEGGRGREATKSSATETERDNGQREGRR